MDELPPIEKVLAKMRQLVPRDRTRYLQTLIGSRTLNPILLHQRALLSCGRMVAPAQIVRLDA